MNQTTKETRRRSYDPIDLCFLELNELMMKRLIESRKEDGPNGKG